MSVTGSHRSGLRDRKENRRADAEHGREGDHLLRGRPLLARHQGRHGGRGDARPLGNRGPGQHVSGCRYVAALLAVLTGAVLVSWTGTIPPSHVPAGA